MKTFTVELYAVEWCGFSEYYQVEAENESRAEDIVLETKEQDFADMYDLLPTAHGWIESEDIDEEDNYDEDDCTTLMATVRD